MGSEMCIRDRDGTAADLIAFLRGDGSIIWERYVREIGRRESGRDFSPLDLSEKSSFQKRIRRSFRNSFKKASILKAREIEKISTRRIWWGLSMLLVGFVIIAATYYVIPEIGSAVFKKRQQEIQATIRPHLDEVTETIGEQTDVNRELLSCLLYTSPSPRDATLSRMPSSA